MIRPIRLTTLLFAAALMAVSAVPVSAQPLHVGDGATSLAPAKLDGKVGVAPDPCRDAAYRLIGAKWANGSYDWSFRASSVPGSLGRRVVRNKIIKAFHNMTSERNDCGRVGTASLAANYLGTTKRKANCNSRDGHNVVAFGRLPAGILAVTCYWTKGNRIVEADMKFNSRESWALSLRNCHAQVMLEATVTHEAGHVFGLDHVSEVRHGRLTMSPYIDDLCENQESTLGLGDMLGLEALY